MTENEAKYYLLESMPIVGFKTHNEALDVAINALSEIQQYRAIGDAKQLNDLLIEYSVKSTLLEEYKAIGTIEEFKALKEKIAKIEFILNEKNYIKADECDYGNYYTCENALMIKDIEEIING